MTHTPQPGWQIYKEEPAPTQNYECINFGDVGFIRRGRFHLLFSAGRPLGEQQLGIDVPPTFKELNVGLPVFCQPRGPGCLGTDTVQVFGAGLGTSVATAPFLEPGTHLSYELTGKRGAALVTRHETYVGDAQEQDTFERYIKKHYASWVTFARNKRFGNDVEPILVSGFDLTKDFAMAAYSNNGAFLESDVSISVPMIASASASLWGSWRTRGLIHKNHGPQQCIPPSFSRFAKASPGPMNTEAVSDDYNQCVFIRYYTMRKIAGFYLRVLRASAGPHDLGPGNNHDNTFSELVARQDPLPDEDDPVCGEDQEDLTVGEAYSDQDVVYNVPADGNDDEFDAIAEYVFKNSNATSVLMHHKDLVGVHVAGGISSILAKSRLRIVVDENGVGEIICTEDSSQRLTDPVANHHYHSGGNSFQEISRVLAPTPATEYLGGQEIDPRPSIVEFNQVRSAGSYFGAPLGAALEGFATDPDITVDQLWALGA